MNFFRTTDTTYTTDTTIWKPGLELYLSYEFFSYGRHDRYNHMETRLYRPLIGFFIARWFLPPCVLFFLLNDQLPRIFTMIAGNCFLVTIKSSKGFIKYNQYNWQICYSRKFVLFQEHILVRGMPEEMPIVNVIQGLEFQILFLFLSEKHVCKRQHYSQDKS